MRYPTANNPIRERIFNIRNEMKYLVQDIRQLKQSLSNDFPHGLTEDSEQYRFKTNQIMLNNLRDKFRCLHLIYGFVRNKPYSSMERRTKKQINWNHVNFWSSYYGLANFVDIEQASKEHNLAIA